MSKEKINYKSGTLAEAFSLLLYFKEIKTKKPKIIKDAL